MVSYSAHHGRLLILSILHQDGMCAVSFRSYGCIKWWQAWLLCCCVSGSPSDREVHLLQSEQGRVHGCPGEACQDQSCHHFHWYCTTIIYTVPYADALDYSFHFFQLNHSCNWLFLHAYDSIDRYYCNSGLQGWAPLLYIYILLFCPVISCDLSVN